MLTKIADVIEPTTFTPYTVKRSMELSALFGSGIVTNDSQFNSLASGASTLINMPFWGDLDGDSENIVEDGVLTAGKIAAKQDVATRFMRARSWGANNLAAALAGSNPATAIGELVALYWARQYQKELVATLNGVFGSASMSPLTLDISAGVGAAAVFSGSAFIDATQLLGDAKGVLTGVLMHSATEALLRKQNLIVSLPIGEQGAPVDTYQGKRVIVDDGCPVSAGVYSTFLFGQGAIALGNGSPAGIVQTETDRNKQSAAGEDFLITRRALILHPRGVKFTAASVADAYSPTRAELATAANWSRVYDTKQLRIVQMKHKLV